MEDQLAVDSIALACMREVGDRRREGKALNNLGLALQEMRRLEEAIAAHEQAATIFEAFGDDYNWDIAVANLADDRRLRDGERGCRERQVSEGCRAVRSSWRSGMWL
ncbi:tetratricopeptide repeat protein [Nonomuraea sp. NPDC059023]|uniref:tetratricopeptide repeat protein n=1 Tax=unclassified Nonomuraea TaxID=2593643 RepID=UPI003676B68A